MPSRRDILKATGGLVLATGGSWLASHVHAAVPNRPDLVSPTADAVASGDREALAGKASASPMSRADAKEIVDSLAKNGGQP